MGTQIAGVKCCKHQEEVGPGEVKFERRDLGTETWTRTGMGGGCSGQENSMSQDIGAGEVNAFWALAVIEPECGARGSGGQLGGARTEGLAL